MHVSLLDYTPSHPCFVPIQWLHLIPTNRHQVEHTRISCRKNRTQPLCYRQYDTVYVSDTFTVALIFFVGILGVDGRCITFIHHDSSGLLQSYIALSVSEPCDGFERKRLIPNQDKILYGKYPWNGWCAALHYDVIKWIHITVVVQEIHLFSVDSTYRGTTILRFDGPVVVVQYMLLGKQSSG